LNNHRKVIVNRVALDNDIPPDLLLGILTIEMTYRTILHRAIELVCVLVSALLCVIFRRRMKNYTISVSQVGITTILSYFGVQHYIHSKHLSEFKISWLKYIFSAMRFSVSVQICADRLSDTYLAAVQELLNQSMAYRKVGYEYNGRWVYGIMLDNLCETLRNSPVL
jgi:hypothetical protein